jgi:hypothetical protein
MIFPSVFHSFFCMTRSHTHMLTTDAIHLSSELVRLLVSQRGILYGLEHWKSHKLIDVRIVADHSRQIGNYINLAVCPKQIVQSPQR